jgi:uncharacterized protein YndB with AHSA1/START domain
MTVDASTQQHDVHVTRVVDAPPQRVYEAFTDPDQVSGWFVPADGWSAPREAIDMDVRPGGSWRLTMVDEAGNGYPAVFAYREVTPAQRLVFTTGGPDEDPADPRTPTATVTFADLGGRTQLTFAGSAEREMADEVQAGWGAAFDVLAARIAQA